MPDHSRNHSLSALREQHVPRGVGNAHQIFAAQAEGARLWDVDGNEYIDFVGGIGVLNIGHAHPRVIQAAKAQMERFTHTCFQVAMYEPYVRLAEKLNQLAPGDFAKKTFFVTTGAEATENAVKIARAATGRSGIITFANSFHGRTLMGMSMTGKSKPYRQNFGPFAPEVYQAPFPYSYRGWDTQRAIQGFKDLFETQVAPDRVAAVLIEPVLGEGGFIPAPAEFLHFLREITAKYGILLVADEIQSGFGRTGKLFAIEHSGVIPDMITIAKSLAGGFPLAGVIGRSDVMDAPAPGGLGGTYAGNPVSCMAGLAVLEVFEEENLLERGTRLGEKLHETFGAWQQRFPQIGEVRGLGPMIAMEFVRDPESREPAPEIADRIVAIARDHGLLLLKAGLYANVLRVLVPLNIDDELLTKALTILGNAITDVLVPVESVAE